MRNAWVRDGDFARVNRYGGAVMVVKLRSPGDANDGVAIMGVNRGVVGTKGRHEKGEPLYFRMRINCHLDLHLLLGCGGLSHAGGALCGKRPY